MTELYRPLLERAGDCRIITVNDRLARRLLTEYDQQQTRSGAAAWKRPAIESFERWSASLVEEYLPQAEFLSPAQEQCLWEKVIREQVASSGRTLLQIPATARKAREAHRLLQQYATSFAAATAAPDHQVFLRWQQAYLTALVATGCQDRAAILRLLTVALDAPIANPETLLMVGFDDLKPDLQSLCNTLIAAGFDIEFHQPQLPQQVSRRLFRCADAEAEVAQAARWARQQLNSGAERIAVVVPELQRYRSLFQTLFTRELDPQLALEPADAMLPFSISLGGSLADEGLVAAALLLLGLPRELTLDQLSQFLRSGYFAAKPAAESFRSEFELRVRKSRQLSWTYPQLLKLIRTTEKTWIARPLVKALNALKQAAFDQQELSPAEWSASFDRLLQLVGWPGGRGLNSREYQAREKLRDTLQKFATLERVTGRLRRHEAVSLLQRLCQDETFQPEAAEARIEVLGLLESGGLRFDCLWVLGLHDGLLPEPLRPNPFLPGDLQRRLQMPHADLDHETEYCDGLAKQLFSSAVTVVASCPRQEGDTPIRSHHLLLGWPETIEELPSQEPMLLIHEQGPALDSLLDDQAPAIHSRKVISGGTALLKDQALCPFRAFAHHRLKAIAPEVADVGLDAMMRGTLTHNLLELFWRECADSAQLSALSEEALAAMLAQAADRALSSFEKSERRDLPPRLRSLEQSRLQKLGREWLQLEQRRAPFKVLTDQLEQSAVMSFGGLQIRTRIDRVDELSSGELAVIDYKTGRPDPLQWLDERITEPQLPVYAQKYADYTLGAVLFAVVRSGGCRFRGLVVTEDQLPGLPDRKMLAAMAEVGVDSLAAINRRWGCSLTRLAEQFTSGWAAVDPIDQQQACRFCDLTALCRINQQGEAAGGKSQ